MQRIGKGAEDYYEGFSDCTEKYEKTHVPISEITRFFNICLDRYNRIKGVLRLVNDHYEKQLDISGKMMDNRVVKRRNLRVLKTIIKEELKKKGNADEQRQEIKESTKVGKTDC